MSIFHVEINNGPTQTIEVRTGKYNLAAMAALALLDYDDERDFDVVKIWVQDLLPHYGPYYYGWDGHQIGNVAKR